MTHLASYPSIQTKWGIRKFPNRHSSRSIRSDLYDSLLTAHTNISINPQAGSKLLQLPLEMILSILPLCPSVTLDKLAGTCRAIIPAVGMEYSSTMRAVQIVDSDNYDGSGKEILIDMPHGHNTKDLPDPMRFCATCTYDLRLPQVSQDDVSEPNHGLNQQVSSSVKSMRDRTQWVRAGLPSPKSEYKTHRTLSCPGLQSFNINLLQDQGARTESSWNSGMVPEITLLKRITDLLPPHRSLKIVTVAASQGAFDGFWCVYPALEVPKWNNGLRCDILVNEQSMMTGLKDTDERDLGSVVNGGCGYAGVEHLITTFKCKNNDSSFAYADLDVIGEKVDLIAKNLAAITVRANNHRTHHTVILPRFLEGSKIDDDFTFKMRKLIDTHIDSFKRGLSADIFSLCLMSISEAKQYSLDTASR